MDFSLSLYKNRTFILLSIANIFAISGFSMFLTTTTWYIVSDLGMASILGIVLIASSVPRLALMVFGGFLADRFKKTTIMFSTNLVQFPVLGLLTFLVAYDYISVFSLIAISAVFGALDAFFGPASTSMIPKIVKHSQIQKANAVYQGITQVCFLVGPILAGVLLEYGDASISYLIATILIGFSAFFVFPPFIQEAPADSDKLESPLKDIKEGFRYVMSSSFLKTGIMVLIFSNFFVIGGLHLAIPILVDTFGGTPLNLSFMEVSLGIGIVAGTSILAKVQIDRKGYLALLSLFALLVFFILFSQATNLYLLTVLLFFIGGGFALTYIPVFSGVQEKTPQHIMGRVTSLVYLAMNGFDPIAYAVLSALIAAAYPIQWILFSFGLAGLFASILLYTRAKEFIQYRTMNKNQPDEF